ncbi:MAG: ATP-binding protein [Promethearchaeota archaeon]
MINTQSIEKIILDSSMCVHCGWCLSVCKSHALKLNSRQEVFFNEDLCIGCHLCIEICPRGAISRFNSN